MADELLSAAEAARRLGISRASLYAWLGESDVGSFQLRGQPVTIQYFQSGARGQGRIRIEAREIDRLRDLMRVQPSSLPVRRPPVEQAHFPGITVKLGHPRE
jgi:hypothetical protein